MSEFTGTARFTLRRRLGSGGMGVVYLARDRERDVDVALKTLARVDARGIIGLKNEFRALAGVTHPNLVVLHELFCDDDHWFFTMEVVFGKTFLEHVEIVGDDPGSPTMATTPTTAPGADTRTTLDTEPDAVGGEPRPSDARKARPRGLACDVARLRPALRQLAQAVAALHAAGKLHRDLKPSNVLVTPAGRVVILDFGLAVIHAGRRGERGASASRLIEGTPAYMAPEQALGEHAGPASDWYAVGCMLYEALTGRVPFTGDVRYILAQKRAIEPIPPGAVVAGGVPEELDRLCVDLLRISPAARPAGAEVLRRLGVEPLGPSSGARASHAAPPFVGREALLAELGRAFAAVRDGHPRRAVTVHVRGRSGMGKSALVEHFLDEVWRRDQALVLSGRCYERESVPYKAWDSLVDALVRHLCRMPYEETISLVPPHANELARVFPVLREVEVIDEQTPPRELAADALGSRRRAFDALRGMLWRIARHRPLVLHLDDLQWGDVDSAKLMATILAPPDPPPLLLVCSYRSEEADGSEFFRELHSAETAARGLRAAAILDVGSLDTAEAEALARALLGGPSGDGLDRVIAAESEGSPFFVAELVRWVQEDGALPARSRSRAFDGLSLEGVIAARVDRLPADARQLLRILSVAARPIAQGVCARAAGVDVADPAFGALRAANLIRSRGLRPRDLAEPYHDRVREAVVNRLEAGALRDAHLRLALALEDDGGADAEALAAHYEGAGDHARAAGFALEAAEHAVAGLAFGRAARLYRLALSLGAGAGDPAERRRLSVALGDALVNAGRGAEAGPVLLEAAAGAAPAEALELRRRAAEQLLVSGHVDRGAEVLREVLASVGVSYPETQARATLDFLGRQALLRVRGTGFEERPASSVGVAAAARIDVCFTAGKGLTLVDPVRGLGFHAQHLLYALDAGDPSRVCLGLAFHACTVALEGGAVDARTRRILGQARAIAERLGDPYLRGVVGNCTAGVDMCLGRWRATVEGVARANEILRRSCSGVAWEIESGVVCSEVSLLWMGRLDELATFVQSHVREALDRGDLFAATYARMHTWYAPIAADDPTRARAEMREAIARWSKDGFHIMHFWALYAESAYDLYAGDARGARARLASRWPALEGSNVLRVQFHRVWMTLLRAAVATAAALSARGVERARLLREAERDAARLAREGMPYTLPSASLVRAGALAARGHREGALPHLDAAIAGFRAVDMALFAASARRRKGEVIGGEEGRRLVAEADAALSAQGIVKPERWVAMVAPGF